MESAYFDLSTFRFLTALSLNNSRDWFNEHKDDYEQLVREPALRMIRDFSPRLGRISRHFLAVDRKVGGSLMRVQRDIRFSRDKEPYKTNIGIQFRHEVGKDVHAPGFYLHLSPEDCFLAAGVWHPDPDALGRIRQRILEQPRSWLRAVNDPSFSKLYELQGDSLSRAPRGISPDHPLVEDLKRKDHVAVVPLSHAMATSSRLLTLLEQRFSVSRPYVRFLCQALGVPY